ncbi:MAG: DNA internalization-related competence protein ComEC/Rec2 [Desulfuromonadales bacterium]|nr:DNA internalization-related competence protein ComEC/Rec2 [Desulfuromonadales bacterium]
MLLAAYAAGIVLACLLSPGNIVGQYILATFLVLGWVVLRRTRWATWPFLMLLCLIGLLNTTQQLNPPETSDHVSRFLDGTDKIIEARLLTAESRDSGGYRALTESLRIINEDGTSSFATGKILLYIKTGNFSARPGQVIRWRSTLRQPFRFGNPGEFDYPLHLAAQGVYVTAFTRDSSGIVTISNHPEGKPARLENFRQSLAGRIKTVVPDEQAGLVQSLLLGLRGEISAQQRNILADSGIAHLFAISGLHFGLLALLLYQTGKWLYIRSQRLPLWCPPQRILPLAMILPLAFYLVLTGQAWSTRRAFLMVTVAGILIARDRRVSALNLLATVALCLLVVDPLALLEPGFQLSFAGVAGILVWLPCMQNRLVALSQIILWPLLLLLTTMTATLATAPATLWHFHQYAPAGLVTNLAAIPLIAWGAVPLGLASMAIQPFVPQVSDWGYLLCARLVALAMDIARLVSSWPPLQVQERYLTFSGLILLSGFLLALLPYKTKHSRYVRILVLLATLALSHATQPPSPLFRVTALSVGQGDATLISMAGDAHFLIDGGGLPESSIDPGERMVAPALGRLGIDHLDGIILTHNHPDHSSGLKYILQRFPVTNFYYAGEPEELPTSLRNTLQAGKTKVTKPDPGWTTIHIGDQQGFSLFVPDQGERDINERSIAVYARHEQEGVLLTADMGEKSLQQMTNRGFPGPVKILKLPHHGSRHASPESFLEIFRPSLAFVSAGRENVYGFPHYNTVAACKDLQAALFRTDLQGMLTFQLIDKDWQTETFFK